MIEGLVTAKAEVDRAAWEHSGAVDYASVLLILQFFSHLCALLGSNGLYALDDDRFLE